MPRRRKPHVFVSHAHEDSKLAFALKEYLCQAFLGAFDIFVSSDGASIRAGDNWSATLEDALKNADMTLVVVTNASIDRRWVHFESGGAYFLGKPVIPLCCRGLAVGDLKAPLNWLQAIDAAHCAQLMSAIASKFDLHVPSFDAEQLARIMSDECLYQPTSTSRVVARRFLPLFILLDASGSMAGAKINLFRGALAHLLHQLKSSPDTQEQVLFSVITVGSSSDMVIPPTSIDQVDTIPEIQAGGGLSLGAALRYLGSVMENPYYLPLSMRLYRPFVVIVLDAEPTDDWKFGLKQFELTKHGRTAQRLCLTLKTGLDHTMLKTIGTLGVLPLVKPEDITAMTSFLKWVSGSIRTTVEKTEGELTLPPPPPGIQIV